MRRHCETYRTKGEKIRNKIDMTESIMRNQRLKATRFATRGTNAEGDD